MARLFCLIFLFLKTSQLYAWTSWIGTLEDFPVSTESEKDKTVNYNNRVRPVFVKIDQNQWAPASRLEDLKPIVNLPKSFSWDVCFSGRREGSVTANMLPGAPQIAEPSFALRDGDNAPWRTRRSLDYAGFVAEPVYKPIVLSSSLNSSCADPEKWSSGPGEKAKPMLPILSKMFMEEYSKINSSTPIVDSSIRINKAWASKKIGARFVQLVAKDKDKKSIQSLWVVHDEKISFVGFNALVVDYGDFDGDMKTEVLVRIKSDVGETFELYKGAAKVAENKWIYK